MVTPASLPRISGPLACLALLLSSLPAHAQQAKQSDSAKEQSEEAVFIPVEYRPPPYQVSIGVRIAGKAKVKFSGVGNIGYSGVNPGANTDDPAILRFYDNGYVGPDNSRDIAGNLIVKGDGQTNVWAFSSANQLDNPTKPNATTLSMEANRIESSGATIDAESESSPGWDIQITRQLGGNNRFSWGLLFGAGISDVNAKVSGSVKANLHTITDTYLLGEAATKLYVDALNPTDYAPYQSPGPYPFYLTHQDKNADGTLKWVLDANGAPTTVPVMVPTLGADGKQLFEVRDDSIRLPGLPAHRDDDVTQGVDVAGTWQVKGAFMTARFGPYVAVQLARRLSLRASAGITLTVLGAQFKFREEYLVPSINKYISRDTENLDRNESTVTGTFGYYASGEIEWFMTNRTGLFVGASYENYMRKLRITMPETTQFADIETSTGTVIRTGVTTRF